MAASNNGGLSASKRLAMKKGLSTPTSGGSVTSDPSFFWKNVIVLGLILAIANIVVTVHYMSGNSPHDSSHGANVPLVHSLEGFVGGSPSSSSSQQHSPRGPGGLGSNDDQNVPEYLKKKYDVCMVGAGLSGSVLAERYASELKATVLVIDKRHHIGGNCYDFYDPETGIRISQYGAHLFHTKYKHVEQYITQFGRWVDYEHKVRGIVNGKYVPIPVNIETVNTLFDLNIQNGDEMKEWLDKEQIPPSHGGDAQNSEEVALSRVGRRLYDLIFKPYTFKQWAKYPVELGPEVLRRIPVRDDTEDRYFSDPFQALPIDGYTSLFEQMLSSPLITVRTNTDYFQIRKYLQCGRLYFSGPIDAYFADTGWPKLEYRSLDFERVVQDTGVGKTFQPFFVVNHPQSNDDYTRIVEYKHLPGNASQSTKTIYFIERSKDGGEPYYPVPNAKNKELFAKYKELAAKEPGVTFVGRLANYKYFNMDEAIKNALELFQQDTGIPFRGGTTRGITARTMGGQVVDKGLVSYAEKLRHGYQNAPPVEYTDALKSKVESALNLPVGKPYGLRHEAFPKGTDAIMGLAAYPKNMATFQLVVGSLRRNGYTGHIIFGVHKDIPPEEEAYLKANDVTYYEVDFVNCSRTILEGTGESGGAIRGLCSRGLENLKLEWGRFEMCRQWLHYCRTCTGWTLVMDTRDIFFQQSPFVGLGDPATAKQDLLFIEEIAPHSNPKPDVWERADILGASRYVGRTDPCYGDRHYQLYYNRPVLCSGTVIGTRAGMHRFLSVLVDEFHQNNQKPNMKCRSPHATDQWTMNWLYYNGRFGDFDKTTTIPWGKGPINTIGTPCMNRKEPSGPKRHSQVDMVLFDDHDRIVNLHEPEDSPDRIAPAIHQFDRCHNWVNAWLKKHQDLYM